MNLEAVWHDLECGDYQEDLPLWRQLAGEAGGPVLDVGSGTGRVTLDLARRGVEVVALDLDAPLLEALAIRAEGLPVRTVLADARDFKLARRVPLIMVPMQTLQLLGGRAARTDFFHAALGNVEPGGLVVAALADAMDCTDAEHDVPPPPSWRKILGVRYASQLLSVHEEGGQAAILRRREIIDPQRGYRSREVVVRLDRVSADEVAQEASRVGFVPEPHMTIPESEEFVGATVVALRAPG